MLKANKLSNVRRIGHIYLLPSILNFYADWVNYKPKVVSDFDDLNKSMQSTVLGFQSDPSILIIRGTAYVLAAALMLRNTSYGVRLSLSRPIFGCLLAYVLLSVFWSDYPQKVFVNFGHLTGIGLIVLCMTYYFRGRIQQLFPFFALLLTPVLLGSLFIAIVFPEYGVGRPDYPGGPGRWLGIAGNPNTLGQYGFVAMWAGLATIFVSDVKKTKIFYFGVVLLGGFLVWKSGSATSKVLAVVILFGMPYLTSIEKNGLPGILIKGALVCFAFVVSLLAFFIFTPEGDLSDSALSLLGRSTTLTGRTALWQQALDAIRQKPYLGWSFDSNISVLNAGFHDKDFVRSGQFHNGYLDLGVRGGLIGIILLGFLLVSVFICWIKVRRTCFKAAMSFLILVTVICLHNVTEATFVRETALLWFLFVFSYFVAGIVELDSQMASANDGRAAVVFP